MYVSDDERRLLPQLLKAQPLGLASFHLQGAFLIGACHFHMPAK